MAEANVLNQYIATKLLGPQVQAKLLAAQQQQELAKAILEQGATPLDLKDRQIGGVGYAISPLEGLGKMAQMISGKYQQGQANDAYANAFNTDAASDSSGAPSMQGAQGQGALNTSGMGSWANGMNPLDVAEIYNGNRAVAEMIKPTEAQRNIRAAGLGPDAMQSYGKGVAYPGYNQYYGAQGTSAAGLAPAGQLPPGVQAPVGQDPPSIQPPTQGATLQPPPQGQDQLPPVPPMIQNGVNASPAGQALGRSVDANGVQSVPAAFDATKGLGGIMPAPYPGESNAQYDARRSVAQAGQSAYASERGKQLSGTMEEIQNSATDAAQGNKLLDLYQTVSTNGYQGLPAEGYAKFINGLQSVGIANPQEALKAGNTETASALAARMTAEMNNTGGSGKLFQRITNNELGFLQSMAPDVTKTPQGQQALVKLYSAMNRTKQQIGNDAAQYSQVHGSIDDNFINMERQKFANQPLFNQQDIDTLTGKNLPSNNSSTSSNTKTIAGQTFVKMNGQWYHQ